MARLKPYIKPYIKKVNLIGAFFLFFYLIIFLLFPSSVFAAVKTEIGYPSLPETSTPSDISTYVKYIFNFLIWGSGLVALAVLIYAGFRYLTSAGNIEAMKDARDQIFAGLFGLIIIFSAYLLIFTINPQLLNLNIPPIPPLIPGLEQGVYLCARASGTVQAPVIQAWKLIQRLKNLTPEERLKPENLNIVEDIKRNLENLSYFCYHPNAQGNIKKITIQKNDKDYPVGNFPVKDIFFVPSSTDINNYVDYGAIIYEKENFEGCKTRNEQNCKTQIEYRHLIRIFEGWDKIEPVHKEITIKPSSIKMFVTIPKPDPGWFVNIYDYPDYNKGMEGHPYSYSIESGWIRYGTLPYPPQSIWIEGKLVTILSKETGEPEVFFEKDDNLLRYRNITNEVWEGQYEYGFGGARWPKYVIKPAATKIVIIAGNVY